MVGLKEVIECDGITFNVKPRNGGEVELGIDTPAVPEDWSPLLTKNQALGLGFALLWAAHGGRWP